ncbi:hypothetical protein [Kitasatospora sp. NPDC093679]|uniref:hypothetical protein n=1 Tax=Kitasatospora sp. NPDC093679 TaxID=3154983 RepID=UPI00342577F2
MADEVWGETVQACEAPGSGCSRCEETADFTVVRERYRTVARSRGLGRLLAAGVLVVLAVELLLTGRATGAAVAFVLGALSALSFGWVVRQSRSGEPVAVFHCHHCEARYRL